MPLRRYLARTVWENWTKNARQPPSHHVAETIEQRLAGIIERTPVGGSSKK
jgi:hypothetical protein